MSRGGLRRSGGLLGPAVVVALGCGRVVVDGGNEGDATGSTSAGSDGGSSAATGDVGSTGASSSSSDETTEPGSRT